MTAPITLRPITPADAPHCGRILYEAFRGIALKHGYEPDIPSPDLGAGFMGMLCSHPGYFGVVAECEGRIVGSNFLDMRDGVRAVGPITVDPARQARGAGRRLMQAVIDHWRSSPGAGIRLVQDAHNTTSLPLYASLGFDVREPLALLSGTPSAARRPGSIVRAVTPSDLDACAHICHEIHGVSRRNELADALQSPLSRPVLLERDGRIHAYASAPTFWIGNHGVARSIDDMIDLLAGAGELNAGAPWMLLLPTRQAELFRRCLAAGMCVVKSMNLMAIGTYQEPRGVWFPSVAY